MIVKELLITLLLFSTTALAAVNPVVEINEDTLTLIGEVNDVSVAPIINAVERNGQSKKEIVVFIDSFGGSVTAGQRVIDSVERNNAKLKCIVGEKAYSAAFFLLQIVCDKRLVLESSSLLEHTWTIGLPPASIETQLDTLKVAQALFYSIRVKEAKRLKVSYDELMARSNRNWQMLGRGAVTEGAADAVITLKCSQSLIVKRIKVATPFGDVEKSACPLITD